MPSVRQSRLDPGETLAGVRIERRGTDAPPARGGLDRPREHRQGAGT